MTDHWRTKDTCPFFMLFLEIERYVSGFLLDLQKKDREWTSTLVLQVFRGLEGHGAFQGRQEKEVLKPDISQWD